MRYTIDGRLVVAEDGKPERPATRKEIEGFMVWWQGAATYLDGVPSASASTDTAECDFTVWFHEGEDS